MDERQGRGPALQTTRILSQRDLMASRTLEGQPAHWRLKRRRERRSHGRCSQRPFRNVSHVCTMVRLVAQRLSLGTRKTSDMDSVTADLPAYLNTPPRLAVRPPVETRAQELPFGELAWEDFERLCLRLARLEGDVLHCQLYGVRGQNQEGIDLYARLRGPTAYRVYQCKREENFGASKIRKAVEKFVGGAWAATATSLVLCTKESLVETSRADEVEVQRELLGRRGVELVVWDSGQLSLLLKDHPRIVDDFFGRSWVRVFLGAEVADSLSKRLDSTEVANFRIKLSQLYSRVFDTHDPGLPIPMAGPAASLPLRKRYVLTDIIENRPGGRDADPEPAELSATVIPFPTDIPSGQQERHRPTPSRPDDVHSERIPFEAWLNEGSNFLVLGGPGSGKSSLLRHVAVDLLGPSPRLESLAAKWGEYLPVWISFPYWTRLIAAEGQDACSLSKLLHLWLRSLDEERLWPLVEKALQDDRLLLLVDGLDEWASEDAARLAMQRLRVFVEQRAVPSVAASRPQGVERLGMCPPGWKAGRIAPFDRDQRARLATAWFLFRETGGVDEDKADPAALRRAESSTSLLLSELERSRDLLPLAQNPLLLTLLIYHRLHNARLPRSRFRAYGSLIEHLIEVHPARRRTAAQEASRGDELNVDELQQVFARLAFCMHRDAGEGNIPVDDAVRIVEEHLKDPVQGFGMEPVSGRRLARRIVDIGEANLGILVRQSPVDVGFFHRTFQEHLTAVHLSLLPPDVQYQEIDRYAVDPRWREVILALLHVTGRQHAVQELVERLRRKQREARGPDRLYLDSLLSEAAFGDFNCPPWLVRELATEAFRTIETADRMVQREELLGHALGGLASTKARDLVKDRIRSWFPCAITWRSHVFDAMGAYPPVPEVVECLWVAMHDEEPSNQLASARALAAVGSGDEHLGRRVKVLAARSGNPTTRAVALEALTRGWPALEGVAELVERARTSGSPSLLLFALSARVARGLREPSDRDALLRLASHWSGLHYSWRDETARLLLAGWSGDPEVKRACIESLEHAGRGRTIEQDVAWSVLLKGFPQDDDVVDLVLRALEDSRNAGLSLPHLGGWDLLAANFRDHPRLVPAADAWIRDHGRLDYEVARAAWVGRTAVGKEKLIEMLGSSSVTFWPFLGLLRGWGKEDPDVGRAVESVLALPPAKAGWFAHLFPDLIEDKARCRELLLDLLRDPTTRWPDRVLVGLKELGAGQADPEALDVLLDEEGNLRRDPGFLDRQEVAHFFILNHPSDPRVRALALRELSSEEPPYRAVIQGFPDDAELRRSVLDRVAPLPERLRYQIAARLADECPDAGFTLELLGKYRDEEEEHAKVQASISYWRRANDLGVVTPPMVEQLGRDIACYGPDHDEQRQAAFCGLVILGRLDVMAGAEETIGEKRPCTIGIAGKFQRAHSPLARFVAENWRGIHGVFGDDTCKRLMRSYDALSQFWEQLAPVADAFPVVRDELLGFLETRPERDATAALLLFLGRVRPRSIILQEYCFEALKLGRDNLDVSDWKAVVAAELLGRDHAGDPTVLDRVLAGRAREAPYTKTILCLCEGWCDHPLLNLAYRDKGWAREYFATVGWHNLLCTKGTMEDVFEELLWLCSTPAPVYGRRDWTPRPFLRRLRRDDRLAGRLLERLNDRPSPAERVSLPRMLWGSRGATGSLRSWAVGEFERQESLDYPELGHDILAGEERATSEALLDVLASTEHVGMSVLD